MAEDNKPFCGALIETDWDFDASTAAAALSYFTGQIVVGYDPDRRRCRGSRGAKLGKIPSAMFHYIPEARGFDYREGRLPPAGVQSEYAR
ncbi:hypothetical protein [Bradyrhizobium sp. CCGB01]|uniref:hypothetical protein n=1 Tax=Bradyrhizobium sp. CCGB01 TaxID=2949634 RepID=UPI0020B17CC8|nr:hypothetical protein [Bradyrhizobium sp. CCGB01]MCP3404075.1 hypothetical protein [Bradyrhizobium sp. CCGB01]